MTGILLIQIWRIQWLNQFLTREIDIITAAGKFYFEFRGADKAQWAYRYIMQ